MLSIGDRAPDFELKDQSGDDVSLDALTAKGELILYFYPADFTPVCTAEACAFRDRYDAAAAAGVQIVGISPQGQGSHRRFAGAFSLPFPLLSDRGGVVIRAYGVAGPFGFGVRRVTFLIDTEKIIRNRVVADLFVRSHADLVRDTVAARRPQA